MTSAQEAADIDLWQNKLEDYQTHLKFAWGPMKMLAFALNYCLRPVLTTLTYSLERYNPCELGLFVCLDEKKENKELPAS